MARKPTSRWRWPSVLEAHLRELFGQPLADADLRSRLEEVAGEAAFPPLVPFWGPVLYHRNRVAFGNFILEHFPHPWNRVAWGVSPTILEEWLQEVDRNGDLELFRRLYSWKITVERGFPDQERWWADLKQAFTAAASWQDRVRVLAKYDLGLQLGEDQAVELYECDPASARPFILRHLAQTTRGFGGRPGLPRRGVWRNRGESAPQGPRFAQRLLDSARKRNDDDFFFALYRKYTRLADWEADAVRLCSTVADPEQLLKALDERHPETGDVAPGFHALLLERGRDVIPYVLKHLRALADSSGEAGATWLLNLARKFGWHDLGSSILRVCCGPEKFNREIARLLDDSALAEEDVFHRLRLLAGAAWEWPSARGGGGRVHPLSEANALRLYQRFPELLQGPFRQHVVWRTWQTPRCELLSAAIAAGDEAFVDDLAALAVRIGRRPRQDKKKAEETPLPGLERLVGYYEQYRSDLRQFARRAAAVLGRLPADAIGRRYLRVLRTNPLARLLFEDTVTAFAAAPELLRDLLEATEVNVQALALRVLARDAPQVRSFAAGNLDLLLPLLLRPLTRRLRRWAFAALLNAAATPDNARLIHDRARQSLALPARGNAKESLIGLLGQLLHRRPELRRPQEMSLIHARTP
jgi:hypothetical protein